MDAAERTLLRETLAAALDGCTVGDAALAELGWADMVVAEPVDAVGEVFAQIGAAAARADALDDVVATTLGLPPGSAVVHPEWGATGPADQPADTVAGTVGRRGRDADEVHVLLAVGVARTPATAVGTRPAGPDQWFSSATVDAGAGTLQPHPADEISRAVTAARRAIAHQLHGTAAAMLTLACNHARDRVQFGKPIGAFQAVRHKLAETHVAIEAAGEALAVAGDDPLAVDLARILAGRAARDASRHCQQVLAGIGFTRDHVFHRHLFAAIELDGLYGTTAALTRSLGDRLLTERTVPPIVEL